MHQLGKDFRTVLISIAENDDDRWSTPGIKGLLHFRKNGGGSGSRI